MVEVRLKSGSELGKEEKEKLAEIYRQAFNGFPWFENWSREEARKAIESYAESNALFFLAYDGEEIAGAAIFAKSEDAGIAYDLVSEKEARKPIELREIFVLPEKQSRGIGGKLLQEAEKELKEMGYDMVFFRTLIARDDYTIPKKLLELLELLSWSGPKEALKYIVTKGRNYSQEVSKVSELAALLYALNGIANPWQRYGPNGKYVYLNLVKASKNVLPMVKLGIKLGYEPANAFTLTKEGGKWKLRQYFYKLL